MIDIEILKDDFQNIMVVVPKTMGLAFIVLIGGILIGTLIALIKIDRIKVAEKLSRIYLSYVRGIPLIVHLYIVYYALPKTVPTTLVMIITYALYSAASQSENIRAAINAVGREQYEAACSIGLSKVQTWRRIIFPQSFALLIPVFFNVYLGIIKGLSLAFTISVVDILAKAKLCSAENSGYIESYLAAALIYWGLCVTLTFIFNNLEKVLYEKQGRNLQSV